MIALPAGTRIWLAAGVTDMRCGFQGLAAKVQTALEENPLGGHVFIFRGRRGDLVKLLWATDDGLWLLAKRLERGRFIWPQADGGKIHLTSDPVSISRTAGILLISCMYGGLHVRKVSAETAIHGRVQD
ncbi:IS66 family insertion sequence element accessory protein TnpB [Burkholderia gladioli]|nr:IS66 family insertion sequence element accessory protein TnpB [Burkholderia gladioli]